MFSGKRNNAWKKYPRVTLMAMSEYLERMERGEINSQTLSPGGAAAFLGISRSEVTLYASRGKYPATVVYGESGDVEIIDIPIADLKAFRDERAARQAEAC